MEYLMGLTTSPYVAWLQVGARSRVRCACLPLLAVHACV